MGRKKLTYEFVRDYIKNEGYELLSEEYKGALSYIMIRCDKGHVYEAPWNSFKRGHRCHECSVDKYRLTHEYIEEYISKFGYKLLSKYKGNHKLMKIECDKGHKYKVSWNNFKQGVRCAKCNFNNNKGKNCQSWKCGKEATWYNTYAHKIDWIEEVRRDPENNDLLQVRCTESSCRKWFNPTLNQVTSRVGALNNCTGGENSFYCSDECKKNCSIFNQKLYPKGFKNNEDTSRIEEWAEMVKERDGYVCKICGSKENLRAHHYESIWSNPIESADLDMGVTLCKKCHLGKAHKDIGCRFIDLTRKSLCREVEKKE